MPRFTFAPESDACHVCGRPLRVRLTRSRKVHSITYGTFFAKERQGYCPRHPEAAPARSRQLSRIVAPGANLSYDVLARIGLASFLECRNSEEVQMELSQEHGLEISPRTIRHLRGKFVAYFQVVHHQSIGLLRRDMRDRGGYILHVDGTCEEGSRVLLVCLDSLSGQILESRKIGSENSAEIEAVLQNVRRDWGVPLAVVHDLGKGIIAAGIEVFGDVPQFVCHYHLAADVGKDILSPHVDRLRRLFRHTKVRAKLRKLIRSLKDSAVSENNGEHIVTSLQGPQAGQELHEHATPEAVRGTVHALASWILAFAHDGEGYGFPFDMPYLSLYGRILKVHQVLTKATETWPRRQRGPLGPLARFKQVLDTVAASEHTSEFRKIVATTEKDLRIFQRFRAALRICPQGGKKRRHDEGRPISPKRHRALLGKLRASLDRQARAGKRSSRACRIVVQHLDTYWPFLFGHVRGRGAQKILVPRTNNVEESLFRTVKRQCRRLHGRGHLSRDIDAMLPATPLVLNLSNSNYCQTVYGGSEPERIAARFSTVDPQVPARLLKTWKQEQLSAKIPRKLESLENLPQQLARFLSVAIEELRDS